MEVKRLVQGSAFVTSSAGMGAQFVLMDDGSIRAALSLGEPHQGPPGHAHGGALAALVDEAMGAAAWAGGYRVVAANLNLNYRRPVPLGTEIRVCGQIERVEGRKVYTTGVITLPDGTAAMEATGLFIEAPQFFSRAGFSYIDPPER